MEMARCLVELPPFHQTNTRQEGLGLSIGWELNFWSWNMVMDSSDLLSLIIRIPEHVVRWLSFRCFFLLCLGFHPTHLEGMNHPRDFHFINLGGQKRCL